LEDEYFKGALRMMGWFYSLMFVLVVILHAITAKPNSPHHQTVLNSLFKQPPRPSRAYLYDMEADPPEYASLNNIVQDRLAAIFHLHGAVDMEPPLLMPVLDPEEEKNQATFIDRHGDVVTLPNNILVPFARLAARGNIKRIKRFHITNVFRPK
jgi:eukaryotic translation initiation factor 2-alpha kinase 4